MKRGMKGKLLTWSTIVGLILMLGAFFISSRSAVKAEQATPQGLLLWNRLGSQAQIESSEVGLDGTMSGGGFTTGMFGEAYVANHDEDLLVTFPKEVIPIDAGTIEFWGQMIAPTPTFGSGERPYFVQLRDGSNVFEIGFNTNDGLGGGGLVGAVGNRFTATTTDFGSAPNSYEDILGAGQAEDWHHYAVVWDKNGVPGVDDGTKVVAVFVDGQLESARWLATNAQELVPLSGGELGLINTRNTEGSVAIDNLKIWDFAKTDFSDRFSEGNDGLLLWNRLGSQAQVENSEVGLNGTMSGGGFTTGMFGEAYVANHDEDLLVTFPKEVISVDAGTIEFWGKMIAPTPTFGSGERPYFVQLRDGANVFEIGFNGNDGLGGGGLVGAVGNRFTATTTDFGSAPNSYEDILGAGQAEDWHHYAVIWDKNGVPGVDDGAKVVAVFVDGQLESARWLATNAEELVALSGGELGLINTRNTEGSVAIDNLKIWDFAKTDFSDRFKEGPNGGLRLWNKLGSQAEVESSEVGFDGTMSGGGFTTGMFGEAYVANHDEDLLVTFPKEVISVDAGTIEFWGQMIAPAPTFGSGERPYFVQLRDGANVFEIGFNTNDGLGGGGLVGAVGNRFTATTTDFGSAPNSYEDILGAGQAEDWHHYAVIWDRNGIPGVDDGTKVVAVFVDGQLESARWLATNAEELVPLSGGELGLINTRNTEGSVAIDNLKIWDFAKTDFSDRFSEGNDGLVLWNKLGSQAEVESSEVGLDGTMSGGGFTTGMFGEAYVANHDEDLQVTFPKEVIPIDAGTIEFWGKLIAPTPTFGSGERPYFVQLRDGSNVFEIGFNTNDGLGGGGLVGAVGNRFTATTTDFGSAPNSYEDILGAGQAEDWHHYAVVWDKNGVPGVDDGTKVVAVFVDGQLQSARWLATNAQELVPLSGGELGLINTRNTEGSVAIDNLKIWDFAKTDFSDRFNEGASNMITVCANGADHTTIQAAIDAANPADVIDICAGTYLENLTINKALTLQGANQTSTIIDGQDFGSVVTLNPTATVTIANLTITNGQELGGGIFNEGTLTLENTTVTGNVSLSNGGGIFNNGTLILLESTVSGNIGDSSGGGISNSGGSVTLNNSTVSGNHSVDVSNGGRGGGIHNSGGTLTLNNSTVSGNNAAQGGGGIENNGTVELINSTVSGNTANGDGFGAGGGIRNGGTLTLTHSTVSDNSANTNGGGILNFSTVALRNSIVADNGNGGDCVGAITSLGHNLDSDGTCNLSGTGDQPNSDPMLASLAHNGGPTLTHALLPGSPAIDGVAAGACTVATDQRGISRPEPLGALCDIGAYEMIGLSQISGRVTDVNNNPVANVTISDGAGHTTQTDGNGNYTLDGLQPGTYTLTPSKSGYTFGPTPSRVVTVPPNSSGQDFKGYNKPPIVFVHGTSQNQFFFDPNFKQYLQGTGYYMESAALPMRFWNSPAFQKNVPNLRRAIDKAKAVTGQPKVILIAHSQGGLVSRAYVEGASYAGDVAQLFTFGSPHQGIPMGPLAVLFPVLCITSPGVCQMSRTGMRIFNRQHPNRAPGVDYHVISGNAPMYKKKKVWFFKIWVPTHDWRSAKGRFMGFLLRGPDDAVVQTSSGVGLGGLFVDRAVVDEVHSAKWGRRNYFVRDGGRSRSYNNCLKRILVDRTTNTCGHRILNPPFVRGMEGNGQEADGDEIPDLAQHTPIVQDTLFAGQRVTHSLSLEGEATLLATSWLSGTLSVTLVDPNGQTIDPAYVNSHPNEVTYEADAEGALYYFPDAVAGTWQLVLQAENDVPPEGTSYFAFAAFDSALTQTSGMDRSWYTPGATATITASFSLPPATATVTASILYSDGVTDTVTLLPQGGGLYQASHTIPDTPGYTELRLVATGTRADGVSFERGESLLFQITSNSVALNDLYSDAPQPRLDDPTLYETLALTVGVSSTFSGTVSLSAELVDGNGDFVGHSLATEALITGTNTLTLRFAGEDIFTSQRNGPYTLTNLLLTDERDAALVAAEAQNVYVTAAYDYQDFATMRGRPYADAGGPYNVDEAGSSLLSATGIDPEGDALTFAWDLDDDGVFETSGQSVSFSAVGDDGPRIQPIALLITDSSGLTATAKSMVDVLNVAPIVDAGSDVTITEGHLFTATGSFVDPGPDSWSATVDYDDGSEPQALTLTGNSFVLTHMYTDSGVYDVTISVSDDDGDIGSDTLVLTVLSSSESDSFSDFSDLTKIHLNGAARDVNGVLRLTPPSSSQAGSAFYNTTFAITDQTSISTRFQFRVHDSIDGGDGLTFMVQGNERGALGLEGGGLGYTTITSSLAIEIDTLQGVGDPDGNHIAVLSNGSATHLATYTPSFDLADGQSHTMWVNYDGVSDQLDVYLAEGTQQPATPAISLTNIDLHALVGDQAYLGFSAATGDEVNHHDIENWEFSMTSTPASACGALIQEAENGVLSGDFIIDSDNAASGGQYIHVPSGNSFNGPDPDHKAEYCFQVDTAGTYRINGSIYAATGRDNSFYVQVDGAPTNGYLWDFPKNTTYQVDEVSNRNGDDPVEVTLSEGQHTITIFLREDDARLDKLELEFMEPMNPPQPPTCDSLSVEAEAGTLAGDFVIGNDQIASNGQYIHVPEGAGNSFNSPNSAHQAQYCFNVDSAGIYRIKGSIYAASGRDNSFFVQVDDAPANGYLWDFPKNTDYELDHVSDRNGHDPVEVTLSAGQHTVTIFLREDGARLDKLELELVGSGENPIKMPLVARGIKGMLLIDGKNDVDEEQTDLSDISLTLIDSETQGATYQQTNQSNEIGQYYFDQMPLGEYTLTLNLPPGYTSTQPTERSITVKGDQMIEVSFNLNITQQHNIYLPLLKR